LSLLLEKTVKEEDEAIERGEGQLAMACGERTDTPLFETVFFNIQIQNKVAVESLLR